MCCRTCTRFLFVCSVLTFAAVMLGLLPQPALAQTGVDNSTATGVFQMDGNATKDASICFGTDSAGAPAEATPINGACPTGFTGFTFNLLTFGTNNAGVTVPEDWSTIFNHIKNGGATASTASVFETDLTNSTSDNAFLGTASKDTADISTWTWGTSKPQAKDDIAHSYAAGYTLNNGDTAVYMGMDRFANNGASTAGFWLVQDSTFALCLAAGFKAGPDGKPVADSDCKAANTFAGSHTLGDVLIVSDFSIGGAVSTIDVFIWNGTTIPKTPNASFSPAPCDPTTGNSDHCGLVNNAYVVTKNSKGVNVIGPALVPTGGWSFADKTGNSSFATGEFLELGVDLNALFGGTPPCFSTFFAETRSSTSADATLSDLTVPASFPLCSMGASKACSQASIVTLTSTNCVGATECAEIGTQIVRYPFTITVNNTGTATIYDPTVTDDTSAVSTYIAGSLKLGADSSHLSVVAPGSPFELTNTTIAKNGSATIAGQLDSTGILASGDDNKLSSVTASPSSTGSPQSVSAQGTPDWGDPTSCKPPVTPGLTLSKLCETCLLGNSDLHVSVKEGFKLCNTGNVGINSLSVTDCQGGMWSNSNTICSGNQVSVTLSSTSLPPQNIVNGVNLSCMIVNATYTPTTLPSCTSGVDCGTFSDSAIASGTAAFTSAPVNANNGTAANASCPVCPINIACPNFTSSSSFP